MKGKTALITGSTRGIGRSIALELASRGCDILLHGMEDPAQTLEEIQKKGVKAAFVQGNVADYESCRKMAEEAQKHFKQIDILVNNAGITMDRTLKKMTPDEWNKVISVNLGSMYNVTSTVLPLIPDGGRIISISSIAGRTGNFGQTNYAASKAGVIGFTKSLAKELGKRKITVNAVAPGFIQSPMTDKISVDMLANILELIPLKSVGQPEDVARAVAFLASDDAQYITGTVLRVDGGLNF